MMLTGNARYQLMDYLSQGEMIFRILRALSRLFIMVKLIINIYKINMLGSLYPS